MALDRLPLVRHKPAMACLTPLSLAEAVRLGAEYGLEIVSVTPLEAGSVNSNFRLLQSSGDPIFARIYEEQQSCGAAAEIALLSELAALGVVTTAPLQRLDGARVGQCGGKPFSVYPWVRGDWLCHERLTPEHCEVLGAALAQVHLATPHLSQVPEGRFGLDQIRSRLLRVNSSSPRLATEANVIEQHLRKYERQRDDSLPKGLIHGDLFRDNALWKEAAETQAQPELAALLDFESACFGVFVYDLMVCILSWCFTDALDVPRARAMVSGYTSMRPLQPSEQAAAVVEGQLACLRFATTRLTDFELRTPTGQTPKRDFRRFLLRYEALELGALEEVWGNR